MFGTTKKLLYRAEFVFTFLLYRFLPPAGTKIAEEAPGYQYCGTSASGYMQGSHPTIPGLTFERTACFLDCSISNSKEMKVRNCGHFFLYYLSNVKSCHYGYCAK